jgi:hypothetical protein
MRKAPFLAFSLGNKFCSPIVRSCCDMSTVHTRPATIIRDIADGREACQF